MWAALFMVNKGVNMATDAAQFSFSLIDFAGVRGSMFVDANIDSATTVDNLAIQANGLAALVDSVTGAKILETRVTLITTPVGLKANPVVGADLEKTLLINFNSTGTRYAYGVDIPGVNPAKLTGDRPDPTQADIAALIAALIGGNYTNAALQALGVARDLAVTFRKRRRALERVSMVAV